MSDITREQSMDEILSSIRRVISRDDAAARARGEPVANDLDEEEVAVVAEAEPASAASEPIVSEADLLSPESTSATRQSLDALSAATQPSASDAQGNMLEDMVMAALRPMLKDWLDTNLPAIVEKMVAKEISRISGRKA